MNNLSRRDFLAAASMLAAVPTDLAAYEAVESPLKLWFRKPAAQWVDALPVGNGSLGAMVYGGGKNSAASSETLALNIDTLWSGKPRDGNNPDAKTHLPEVRRAVLEEQNYHEADRICKQMQGAFAEAYQPLGTLEVEFVHDGEIADYRRELDLDTASASVSYQVGATRFNREVIASAPDGCIAMQFTASEANQINCTFRLSSPLQKSVSATRSILLLTGKAPAHVAGAGHPDSEQPVVYSDRIGEGMFFACALQATAQGGAVVTQTKELRVTKATALTVYITAETGFRNYAREPDRLLADVIDKAQKRLESLTRRPYGAVKAAHAADYQKLFHRVNLRIETESNQIDLPTDERLKSFANAPDPSLVALYFQYGRYLLISSSRPHSQPANLQGIWNDQITPPWSSNWTANINVQMNYWPAETCNLSECAVPLFDWIADLSENGKRTAAEHYGMPGWVSHHNIDLWRASNPVGAGVGAPTWANWGMSGPWFCQHLYEHYLFTSDKKFLRERAYPIMRSCAEFCLAWLIEDSNGHLTTCPSLSTENDFLAPDGKPAMTSAGCTMDMALMRELFANCNAAAQRLGIDEDFSDKLLAARKRLIPYRIGRYGQLQEWSVDFEESTPGQRHMSHLYGLYPGCEIISEKTPDLAKAAKTSLERRLAHGGAYTGWSRAWAIGFWARLGDGEKAWESLSMLMQHSTNGNLFDTHPMNKGAIFQIDGNFGATAAMAEMLVQSHAGFIDLLPALPKAWSSGEVKGLRVRGAAQVDIIWSEGKAKTCHLRSIGDAEYKIRAPKGQTLTAVSDESGAKLSLGKSGELAVIRLKANDTYTLSFDD